MMMDAYAFQLALAALVGASAVAVSAYYMHRKTLAQLLEFACPVDGEVDGGGGGGGAGDSEKYMRKRVNGGGGGVRARRRKGNGYYRRGSASLPDVTAISGGGMMDGEEKRNGPVPVEGIPAGLPRLHTRREGMAVMN